MRRLTSVLVLAALAVALGSCKDSSPQPATPPPSTTTAPQTAPAPQQPLDPPGSQPEGRLSAAEYASIKREYTLLDPLKDEGDITKVLDAVRPACRAVERPNTPLMTVVHEDCVRGLGFLGAVAELDNATSSCRAGASDEQRRCLADRYLKIALVTQFQLDNALKLNQELGRRRITGLCARSIGITPSQIANLRDISKYGREAAQSVTLGDLSAFDRAQEQLLAAIRADDGGDPLTGIIRGCKHGRSVHRTPRPRIPRRQPPLPLPSEPDGNGINA